MCGPWWRWTCLAAAGQEVGRELLNKQNLNNKKKKHPMLVRKEEAIWFYHKPLCKNSWDHSICMTVSLSVCTSDTPYLSAYHRFSFIFSCSLLQNTCKHISYQSAEQLWAGCAPAGEWGGKITELSPPAIRNQVINPDYFRHGFSLCFNNSVALLLPLCWEQQ